MKKSRISWAIMTSVFLLLVNNPAVAQTVEFPSRPVKMIVGYPPGGGNDLIARALSQRLSEMWGQPVVVENRAGASGRIGADFVARSAPDGYTLLLTGSSHLIVAATGGPSPYRPIDDFTPVSAVCTAQIVLEVNPSFPPKTVQELIALARSQPGRISFGSAGYGTSPHLAGELFKQMAGIEMTHVPYKGSGPAQTDLIGGQIQVVFQVAQVAIPSIKSGQVRALAVTGKSRIRDLPNVPTIAESGLPDYEMSLWWGVLAPAGLPRNISQSLSEAIQKAVAYPEVEKRLGAAGLQAGSSTSEELMQIMRKDFERYSKLIREAGIK